ncbi:hypothetical protein E3T33_09165 [Cryobacterium sp. TMT1-2-1]|uniref:hypothetical protein n=1 Tax=Cryobacterium sp. TMT1-2-1 TaxID=1259232 RepID=UPI00106C9973|nr:hypothetical protein [Cryobacterium sp. TMT1-2-1]TFD44322.1 hypothetical protein E3T33_09165 [Cryobacterium sp. TMT1-2-1]
MPIAGLADHQGSRLVALQGCHELAGADPQRLLPDPREGLGGDDLLGRRSDEGADALHGRLLEQPECGFGAGRKVERREPVEEVGRDRFEVHLSFDRNDDLVDEECLKGGVFGERGEGRHKEGGVRDLRLRPERDHRDGREQGPQRNQQNGEEPANPAPRSRAGPRRERPGFHLAPQAGVLRGQAGDLMLGVLGAIHRSTLALAPRFVAPLFARV